ncbi:hypothetical protein OROGR_024331 [Orobanche gracilis]
MLFFLITCSLSFIFFYKSLVLKPLPPWACEMRLLSLWCLQDLSFFSIAKSSRNIILSMILSLFASKTSPYKKTSITSRVESVDVISEMSVLDLPDLVLESIFEKLPPEGLCKMACVCASLRDRCMSDHLWEKHIKNKWARVVGTAAYREWQWRTPSRKGSIFFNPSKRKGLIRYLNYYIWPIELIRSSFSSSSVTKNSNSIPTGSIMSWYFALESGKFWFPAQVYNRENGHVGFTLSCYDAELCYDMRTNTFQARYPPHGRRASPIEIGVTWDRLRASPVDTFPHDLHVSDCLKQLKPGDHIEIQWRRNKEFPYGWWYGVVGHLETCDGNPNSCLCQDSDILVLEFNQYTRGSRWRRTTVNKKEHGEEGNETDGFYGGIRKLCGEEEISVWKKLWPSQVLE